MPSTIVGPITVVDTQLRIEIRYIPDAGVPTVYVATVSEGKHMLESYRESNVTTGDSGMNTNTIARVDRATFRRAFESWARACAKRLEQVGPARFVPRDFTHPVDLRLAHRAVHESILWARSHTGPPRGCASAATASAAPSTPSTAFLRAASTPRC